MIKIILLTLFLSCLFSYKTIGVFEINVTETHFIDDDLVEFELIRQGGSVDDLLVEWTSLPPIKWEFINRKVGE